MVVAHENVWGVCSSRLTAHLTAAVMEQSVVLHRKPPECPPKKTRQAEAAGYNNSQVFFCQLPRDCENTISFSFHALSVTGVINLVLTDHFTKKFHSLNSM